MAADEGRRRLTTILAADVAGYSRLMADDERATVATLTQYRDVFAAHVESHDGRIVDTAGDSVLATFDSVVEAVEAAVEIQRALGESNAGLDDHRRMHFRIGINLGDIIIRDDGTIYGDGVNVAARLESLAAAGGVMVAEDVHKYVAAKVAYDFADAGKHDVKNIAEPVRAYRVLLDGSDPVRQVRKARTGLAVATGIILLALIGGGWWLVRDEAPPTVTADGAATDDPVLALPTGPSIAVLPFDNLSGDPEQDYFVDGLTEQIITELTFFEDLFVIARNSTFRYKGQAVDVREVGRDLGVAYVLEGSVRQAGTTIRITAQLLDADTGGHLWAEDYERALTADNIFALQDEISAKVVSVLAENYGVIARARMSRLASRTTDSLDAFDCVLRARAYLYAITPEHHLEARTCLERAIEIDPDYGEAWDMLAWIYADEHCCGLNPRPDGPPPLDLALKSVQRAIELDPDSPSALFDLSRIHFLRHELPEYFSIGEKAISLNPNNGFLIGAYALHMIYAGKWERGIALLNKARALNPYLPGALHYGYSNYYYHMGEYDKALDAELELNLPGFYWTHIVFAEIYGQLGRAAEAKQAVKDLMRLYPDFNLEVARDEMRFWNFTESHIEHRVEGLRKAGVPDAPAESSRPVIAVLPFDNMSGDPEQEYFADGITEDLITELQRRRMLVIARNSTFRYKGEAVDVRVVARELGASHVVEGSVRRAGETVKVTAQLLAAETGEHLWAETYEEALNPSNIFAIQERISGRIATAIGHNRGAIAREGQERARRTPPESLAAYECVLFAQSYLDHIDAEMHATARDCLERIVESEPDYVQARVWLATVYLDEHMNRYNPRPDPLDLVLAAAREAVRRDPTNAEAHSVLAIIHFFAHDLDLFFTEAEQALSLSPNDATFLDNLGLFIAYAGDWDRGIAMIEQAKFLDPLMSPVHYFAIGHNHLRKGETDKALAAYLRIDLPEYFPTWRSRAVAYAHLGRLDEARDAVAKMLALYPDYQDDLWTYLRDWNFGDDFIKATVEGLRLAGLDVPDEPVAIK